MLLNNNQLPNTFGLLDIFSHFLVQPMKLMWLDLSFNILKTIDPVRLHHTYRLLTLFPVHYCIYMIDFNLPIKIKYAKTMECVSGFM